MTYLFVLIQEHSELAHADALVPIVKAVGDVPPQGPKLAPLLNQGMEECHAQQKVLEGHRLAATLKELHVGQGLLHVAAPHVAPDALHLCHPCGCWVNMTSWVTTLVRISSPQGLHCNSSTVQTCWTQNSLSMHLEESYQGTILLA